MGEWLVYHFSQRQWIKLLKILKTGTTQVLKIGNIEVPELLINGKLGNYNVNFIWSVLIGARYQVADSFIGLQYLPKIIVGHFKFQTWFHFQKKSVELLLLQFYHDCFLREFSNLVL